MTRPRARPLLALLGTAAASAALGAAAASADCRARQPGAAERAVMTALKHHVTVGGRGDRNPLPDTPREVARGRQAFGGYCATCHGADGRGTGVPFAEGLSPPLPRLDAPEVQAYTDGQLKWVIEHGLFPSGMPASRGLLSDEEMWRIVVWLRHLPPKETAAAGKPPPYERGP